MKTIAAAAFVLFIILSCYSVAWNERNHHSLSYIFAHPEIYNGKKIILDEVKIVKNSDDGFFVWKDGLTLKIKYPDSQKQTSGIVSVKGILRINEGYVEATEVHYHRDLYLKYLLSPAGLAILLYFFFRDWRITKRGVEEK
ncbi:MAG: hypothetical protein QME59_05760 [Candidatus Hydrothermarchaeota archaeon]|nr:hypothetical protein [Candidatus Hydrothermarchaeota archaeon]